MRIVRLLLGLLLIPVCVALTLTAMSLLGEAQQDGTAMIPPTALAIATGYLLWIVLYYTMPRPIRTYILAHELTHALWGALMGARVSKLRVKKNHGSVTLSKTNFLITLAPYFFPLYTVLVVCGYYVLLLFYDVGHYYLFWLGLVGFTWGFHFTFTVAALSQSQEDVKTYGVVFSYAVIYAINILGICLWIVGVSHVTLADALGFFDYHAEHVFAWCREAGMMLYAYFRQ